jgi:hypothetical protein
MASYYRNYQPRYSKKPYNAPERKPLMKKTLRLRDPSHVHIIITEKEAVPLIFFRNWHGRQFFSMTREEFLDVHSYMNTIYTYMSECQDKCDAFKATTGNQNDAAEQEVVIPRSSLNENRPQDMEQDEIISSHHDPNASVNM